MSLSNFAKVSLPVAEAVEFSAEKRAAPAD